jgi:hypothetical protein
MMEETYLVEHIKDTVCFVSPDLKADLASARAGAHRLEYVLPDGVNEQLGHVRQPQPRERGKTSAADKAGREQVLPGLLLVVQCDVRSPRGLPGLVFSIWLVKCASMSGSPPCCHFML